MSTAELKLLDQEQKRTQRAYEEHLLGCFRCLHGKQCERGERLRNHQDDAFLAWSLSVEEGVTDELRAA